jgi:hypothetical protein
MTDAKKVPSIYPCVFPVKIVGENSSDFESTVLSVMERYLDDLQTEQIGRKSSHGGKYMSLTINIIAKDREFIDKLYEELNALEKVIMVI